VIIYADKFVLEKKSEEIIVIDLYFSKEIFYFLKKNFVLRLHLRNREFFFDSWSVFFSIISAKKYFCRQPLILFYLPCKG